MNRSLLLLGLTIAIIGIILQSNGNNFCFGANANVNQLEGLKAQFLPPEFRNTNFTVEEIKKILRDKCKKASGTDNSTLYKEIEKAALNLTTCLGSAANFTGLQDEIEKARPIGELDTVFNKYCTKAPTLKNCLTTFNTKIQPCLTSEERKQNEVLVRVLTNLLGFMCAKGGDQIALFVAEEGPECFEANKESIQHCMNISFYEYLPTNKTVMPDLKNLPELILSPKNCVDLQEFESCTLHHLKQCREITPANLAESVFRFIKNETSCKSWMEAKSNERSVLQQPRNNTGIIHPIKLATVGIITLVTVFF